MELFTPALHHCRTETKESVKITLHIIKIYEIYKIYSFQDIYVHQKSSLRRKNSLLLKFKLVFILRKLGLYLNENCLPFKEKWFPVEGKWSSI